MIVFVLIFLPISHKMRKGHMLIVVLCVWKSGWVDIIVCAFFLDQILHIVYNFSGMIQ